MAVQSYVLKRNAVHQASELTSIRYLSGGVGLANSTETGAGRVKKNARGRHEVRVPLDVGERVEPRQDGLEEGLDLGIGTGGAKLIEPDVLA